jgi:hypothetical protein
VSGLSRALLLFILVVVAGGVVVAVRGRGGPAKVGEVPATLPAAGVDVGGQVVLKPLTQPPPDALSTAAAIAKARRYATKRHFPAAALEASLSEPGGQNPTLENVAAWVVTFTSPKATNVSQGGHAILVRHFSVALDAVTGKFLTGFFTK